MNPAGWMTVARRKRTAQTPGRSWPFLEEHPESGRSGEQSRCDGDACELVHLSAKNIELVFEVERG